MIYYNTTDWVGAIFRYDGTVWASVLYKWMALTCWVGTFYVIQVFENLDLGTMGHSVLGHTLSFLLVFRANSAYAKYWMGRTLCTNVFLLLRDLVMIWIQAFAGGKRIRRWRWRNDLGIQEGDYKEHFEPYIDQADKIRTEELTHMVRYCLCIAISFKMHLRLMDGFLNGGVDKEQKYRIDWDRFRMRQLLNADEFRQIDRALLRTGSCWEGLNLDDLDQAREIFEAGEPPEDWEDEYEIRIAPTMRVYQVLIFNVFEICMRNMNNMKLQDRPYAVKERFVPNLNSFLTKIAKVYDFVNQIIATPLPFPYFHLAKCLLMLFFLTYPMAIKADLGVYACVVEYSFMSLALLGVDAIATELENPFGDDDNDLDVLSLISHFESEALHFLKLAGEYNALDNFVWQDMPEFISEQAAMPLNKYVSLKVQVDSAGKSNDTLVAHIPRLKEVVKEEDPDAEANSESS